ILIFTGLPVILLYVGALAAEADLVEHTGDFLAAMIGVVLLAAVLAALAALVASHTRRRALAVGITILAVLLTTGGGTAVQAVTREQGGETAGLVAGLCSPCSLGGGVQGALLGGGSWFEPRRGGTGWGLLCLLVFLAVVVGALW